MISRNFPEERRLRECLLPADSSFRIFDRCAGKRDECHRIFFFLPLSLFLLSFHRFFNDVSNRIASKREDRLDIEGESLVRKRRLRRDRKNDACLHSKGLEVVEKE